MSYNYRSVTTQGNHIDAGGQNNIAILTRGLWVPVSSDFSAFLLIKLKHIRLALPNQGQVLTGVPLLKGVKLFS